MPALIHCTKPGDHKARVASIAPGGYTYAITFGEADGLRRAAYHMGLAASVNALVPGRYTARYLVRIVARRKGAA